ncbi:MULTISPECIES: rhomboid family intramembrane serine protease [Bacillaceae]|uniref:Peptidase S54 n=1 Tax=Alkalicoccobacillus plakortidis TaxID=444060 RepID=A0A9D5I0J6_9BACI|nr:MULTISPECIES: rhomboid family intramembrane serine protease [Bacillaceae]KQL56695.1 peptidase S54 [Alkalicoccobacillus plakortidis]
MFFRNETFSSYTRNYPVVTTIIALNLLIFILMMIFPIIRERGVGFNLAIEYGEYWRLITPIFLHNDLFHLAFNMGALLIFGPALESMIKKWKFVLLFLLPGILANIVTFYLQHSYYMHLGASGSIYGLFGVYLFIYLYREDLISRQTSQIIVPLVIIGVIMTFLNPSISITGHIFGLVSGGLLAPLFLKGASTPFIYRTRTRKAYFDDDKVSFNPDRWKNRERNRKIKKALLILGIILFLGFVFLQSLPQ